MANKKGTGLMMVWADIPADKEDDFNRWYNEEHLAELLSVQGVLNAELRDTDVPVVDADFEHSGDLRSFWTEHAHSDDDDIALTWYDIGEPALRHTQPFSQPDRPYGSASVLIPCMGARLTINGEHATGYPQPREWDGKEFSSCALAFAESWTEWP